jgi:hypothetical protein
VTPVEQLRAQYRPKQLRLLLVAESPPDCRGGAFRFFYAPTMKHDHLYLNVMKVMFSDFDPASDQKTRWLERFQMAGGYLVDATDTPVNGMDDRERKKTLLEALPSKLAELKVLAGGGTPIILIKRNVCELFNVPLREAGLNVINRQVIPFPSNGNQGRFNTLFRECLNGVGLIPSRELAAVSPIVKEPCSNGKSGCQGMVQR